MTHILRRIYPQRTRCPNCTGSDWSSCGTRGRIRYRRCHECDHVYPALPIAVEVDRGGDQSEIVIGEAVCDG